MRVDGELNRIATEVLADSDSVLVVEIQALVAPQTRWRTV